ncbi:MAG: MFS transporter [Beijerinckiaceae bacterium]
MNAPSGKPVEVVSGPIPPATPRIFFRVFPSVMLPMFLAMSDQTIVASALPTIAGALGDVERVSWIVVAYLLAATISAPLYGYLGDSFGRRRLMFIALGVFTLGAILNSLASSVTMIAMTRFVQGLGGGGLMSMSQALIGEVVPPRQRGQYQGYMAAIGVTAAALGPVAGAYLAAHFGWRAVFLMNVPTAIFAGLMMLRLAPRPGSRKEDWNFDTPGLLLFIGFVVPALLALEQARRLDMTMMPTAGALLAFSIVSLVLLVRRERRAPAPLLPIQLMRQRAIWSAQAMAACHGAALVALIAFTPLYMRMIGIGDPAQVSWALLTISGCIGFSAMVCGRIITRTGYTMILPSIGSTGATVMFVYLATQAGRQTLDQFLVWAGITAVFMGSVMGVVQVTIQTAAGRRMLGAASGSIQFARSVGASFGAASFGAVLFATAAASDPAAGALFVQILQKGPGSVDALDPARNAALNAVVAQGFANAFLALALFTGIGALLAWINPQRRV